MLSCCQGVIVAKMSCCHGVMLPRCYVAMVSCCQSVMLPRCHVAMVSSFHGRANCSKCIQIMVDYKIYRTVYEQVLLLTKYKWSTFRIHIIRHAINLSLKLKHAPPLLLKFFFIRKTNKFRPGARKQCGPTSAPILYNLWPPAHATVNITRYIEEPKQPRLCYDIPVRIAIHYNAIYHLRRISIPQKCAHQTPIGVREPHNYRYRYLH
jgi:hypothetical protein